MKQPAHIVGVRRAPQFSPNHTGTDGAIFSDTVQALESKGYKVRQMTEEEFLHTERIDENVIFAMARNKPNVQKLQQLERDGKVVINSGYGIEKCYRANMTKNLLDNQVPHPKSIIVPTDSTDLLLMQPIAHGNTWVKRGDFHTMHKEDISFCQNEKQCRDLLKEYALRGIPEAVISEHLNGDLVKFYAVEGTAFFHWFYPIEQNHIKFETHAAQEKTQYYTFDENKLKKIASNAAAILNIKIHGGDAIISPQGDIRLIDVNDWPSFAPCRKEAVPYIAACIMNSAK